jgi:hypothetical protein
MLFIYGALNDVVSAPDFTASDDKSINGQYPGKDTEETAMV